MTYREHLHQRLDESGVPRSLHAGLTEYIAARRPVGSFLTAVLSNDLQDAVIHADPMNRRLLPEIVLFLVHYVPGTCWGSPETVARWLMDPSPAPEIFE
jgi:hypothetical protein